jgi:hypothetical protein
LAFLFHLKRKKLELLLLDIALVFFYCRDCFSIFWQTTIFSFYRVSNLGPFALKFYLTRPEHSVGFNYLSLLKTFELENFNYLVLFKA